MARIHEAAVRDQLKNRIKKLEAQLAEYKDAECRAVKREGEALAQLEAVRPYLFHTPDCDMSIAHDLMGTAPNGCNCGLIELQAAIGEGS